MDERKERKEGGRNRKIGNLPTKFRTLKIHTLLLRSSALHMWHSLTFLPFLVGLAQSTALDWNTCLSVCLTRGSPAICIATM